MSTTDYRIIKKAPLTNNCPECFNQDLTLTFAQKHVQTRLFHKTTPELRRELKCNTCHTIIYPVSWTEDIERTVGYYEKAVQPEKTRMQPRPLFYILLILVILLAGVGIYLYSEGIIPGSP